ncbi:META domain-containing protein [Bordetella sp. 15P40C-2]|nr:MULTISPECIES: META domain-containing protein [unclassified Bordetella]MVW70255.1 META domain-containing protein [Bordetella sp. 15P40C-2]MVW78008.1 META domain-containing protein [Bordetella sp. 02P26C-1]
MFRKLRVSQFVLAGLVLGAAGCAETTVHTQAHAEGAAATHAATSADSFAQTAWQLTRWVEKGGASRPIALGQNAQPVELVFLAQGKEYRVNGYSGCNRYFGNYRLQDGKLSISVRGNTRMACPDPARAALENAYLKALGEVSSFTLDSGSAPRHLTFNLRDGDVLEFTRTQDPPTPQ